LCLFYHEMKNANFNNTSKVRVVICTNCLVCNASHDVELMLTEDHPTFIFHDALKCKPSKTFPTQKLNYKSDFKKVNYHELYQVL
jgi:hypothetical protein